MTEESLIAPPDATAQYTFMATGDTDHFSAMAQRFLGPEVTGVTHMQIRTNKNSQNKNSRPEPMA